MKFVAMPEEPTADMVNAAYMLIETMKTGTPERHKRIVREVWRAMRDARPQPAVTGLTPLQYRVQEIIADWIDDHGKPPRYSDIAAQLGKGKDSVYHIIRGLERRGVVAKTKHAQYSLRLLVRPGEPIRKP